jgi:transposase-like protein
MHGKREGIQDFYCQSCNHKFTARRNTVSYRLKTPSQTVGLVLWLLALGVDVSALEEACQIGEGTMKASTIY